MLSYELEHFIYRTPDERLHFLWQKNQLLWTDLRWVSEYASGISPKSPYRKNSSERDTGTYSTLLKFLNFWSIDAYWMWALTRYWTIVRFFTVFILDMGITGKSSVVKHFWNCASQTYLDTSRTFSMELLKLWASL